MNDLGRRLEVETGPSSSGICQDQDPRNIRAQGSTRRDEAAAMNLTLAYRGRSTLVIESGRDWRCPWLRT